MCAAITDASEIPTVGWRTITLDPAARAFSHGLVEQLVTGGTLGSGLAHGGRLSDDSLAKAFRHGVLQMKVQAQKGTDRYAIADPNLQPKCAKVSRMLCAKCKKPPIRPEGCGATLGRLPPPDNRLATGIPLLLRYRRFGPSSGLPSAARQPSLPIEISRAGITFTGQQSHLQRMRRNFFYHKLVGEDEEVGSSVGGSGRMAVLQAIRGLGGIGKTELAMQYALANKERYPAGVFYLAADAARTELELLRRLATALSMHKDKALDDKDELRDRLHTWLQLHAGWLLIVDNADEADSFQNLKRVLPPPDAPGHVVITSRVGSEEFGGLGVHDHGLLTLGVLAPEDAEVLLWRSTGLGHAKTEAEARDEVKSLPDEKRKPLQWLAGRDALDCLPLALCQAGTYIRQKRLSLEAYRRRFEVRQLELLKTAPSGCALDEQRSSVYTTWDISFAELLEKHPAAAELLQLASLLAPDGIPVELFERLDGIRATGAASGMGTGAAAAAAAAVAGATDASGDETGVHRTCPHMRRRLEEAVEECEGGDASEELAVRQCVVDEELYHARSLSLLETNDEGQPMGGAEPHQRRYVSIHRLVQDAQRRRLGTSGALEPMVRLLAERLSQQWPFGEAGTPEDERFCEKMAEAAHLMRHASALRSLTLIHQQKAFARGASLASVSSAEGAALANASSSRACMARATSPVIGALANAMLGRIGQLGTLKAAWLPADLIAKMGHTCRLRGELNEAEAHLKDALALRVAQLGEINPETLALKSNLAETLGAQSKHAEAFELLQAVMHAWTRHRGANHVETLNAMANQAALLRQMGKLADAETCYRDVIKKMRTVMDEKDELLLSAQVNLAATLCAQGREFEAAAKDAEADAKHAEAEPLQRSVLALRREVLGPSNIDTMQTMADLATTLFYQEKDAEAIQLQRDVLTTRKQVLQHAHQDIISAMNNLAAMLASQTNNTALVAEGKALEHESKQLQLHAGYDACESKE